MTTNTTSVGFVVQTTLVAALQALVLPGWTVYDGNQPVGDTPQTYIVVGSNTAGEVLDLAQDWHSLGLQAEREETGVLYCTVASWDGEASASAACVARVRDAIADLDATARQMNAPPLEWAVMTSAKVTQAQTSSGVQVSAAVEITYRGLLLTWP